jgi:pimeloyl-ACP methyl ester carboxylesterase
VPTFHPASRDPKFGGLGLDFGYLTTVPRSRGDVFYYVPGADAHVSAMDEQFKDTITAAEGAGAVPLITSPPPETAPSRNIAVPMLVVLGEHDGACSPPGATECTAAAMRDAEAPYYSAAAHLRLASIRRYGFGSDPLVGRDR